MPSMMWMISNNQPLTTGTTSPDPTSMGTGLQKETWDAALHLKHRSDHTFKVATDGQRIMLPAQVAAAAAEVDLESPLKSVMEALGKKATKDAKSADAGSEPMAAVEAPTASSPTTKRRSRFILSFFDIRKDQFHTVLPTSFAPLARRRNRAAKTGAGDALCSRENGIATRRASTTYKRPIRSKASVGVGWIADGGFGESDTGHRLRPWESTCSTWTAPSVIASMNGPYGM